MKTISAFVFCSFILFSCNPVGEKISGDNPTDPQLVNTEDQLNLKKGDVLVVWGKLDATFVTNGIVPSFNLTYNLSLDGNTVSNATLPMFNGGEKRINSDYSVQEEEKEDRQEEDSTRVFEGKLVKASWQFEQEVTRIPIEKDGKYTFDYKIKSTDDDGDSMFNKTSVILRKN
ncbi:MAG: hypothetical protein LBE92_16055 [Chryseobacterium sp.]|jgi:hypothetical protein|uniref:hypothetical protein n=1 Tax=Chryseobacterium sp. TaxID=1871047 RepID=UPI00281FBD34|nr:hypothetical protein [Chryseobacterium sp.]MDR2237636.1 hypothetical protein [Chryseobacterium sp.]